MKHGSSWEAVLAVDEPCLEIQAFISSMVLHLGDCVNSGWSRIPIRQFSAWADQMLQSVD